MYALEAIARPSIPAPRHIIPSKARDSGYQIMGVATVFAPDAEANFTVNALYPDASRKHCISIVLSGGQLCGVDIERTDVPDAAGRHDLPVTCDRNFPGKPCG